MNLQTCPGCHQQPSAGGCEYKKPDGWMIFTTRSETVQHGGAAVSAVTSQQEGRSLGLPAGSWHGPWV